MQRCTVLLVFVTMFWGLSSPVGAVDEDARLWVTSQFKSPERNRMSIAVAIQPRFRNSFSDLERVLIRPTLNVALNDVVTGTLGYDVHALHEAGERAFEHRIWQQLKLQQILGQVEVEYRARLEERWIENVVGNGIRGRLRVRAKIPNVFSEWYVAGGNEVLYNLNSLANGPQEGYDQNRVFLSVGRTLRGRVHFELGYQMQHVQHNVEDRINHIIMIGLSLFSLDNLQDEGDEGHL